MKKNFKDGNMQNKWNANFINDPDRDFELMVEICYEGIDVAIITQEKQDLELKIYKNDKNIVIPFEWLFEVMNKARDALKMNNIISKDGKIIWRCSRSLLIILNNCLKVKIKKYEFNESLHKVIKQLNKDLSSDASILIEIGDIFKSKKDIQPFILILHECLNEISKKFHWPDEIKNHIYKYFQNLE